MFAKMLVSTVEAVRCLACQHCLCYCSTYYASIVIATDIYLFTLFTANWVSTRWQWSVDLYQK